MSLKSSQIFQNFPELEELEICSLNVDSSFIPMLPKLRELSITAGNIQEITSDSLKSVTYTFCSQYWTLLHTSALSISGREIENVTLIGYFVYVVLFLLNEELEVLDTNSIVQN